MRRLFLGVLMVAVIAGATDANAQCPTPPTLVSPLGGTVPFGSINFEWNAAPNAASYELVLSINGGQPFSGGLTTGTSRMAAVGMGQNVDWKVIARKPACPDVGSAHAQFTTSCPDAGPVIAAPARGARFTAGTPIKLAWTGAPLASSYTVLVTPDFGATFRTVADRTASREVTVNLEPGDWGWTVIANYENTCGPVPGEPSHFFIDTACSTAPVQLVSPANGATNVAQRVTFDWNPVPGAIGYVLLVSTDGTKFDVYGATGAETEIERSVPAGTIKWLVVARFADCPEVRSSVFTFEAGQQVTCPTGSLAFTTPSENANVQSPVGMSWSAIQGALAYRVWVSIDDEAPVIVAKTTATQASINLPAGRASAYIEALLPAGCEPITSPERHFTVAAAQNCASNPAPALVSPVGTEQNPAQAANPVELRWNPTPGAIGYRIWIAQSDDDAFEDIALTTETHVTRTLRPGSYVWFAQALFANCRPVDSPLAYFVIPQAARCNNGAPALTSPVAGSTNSSPVTFNWNAVAGAAKYRVFLSVNGEDVVLIGTTTDTTLTKLLPPGTFLASVEAVFPDCPSTFAPRITFVVEREQLCAAVAPTPVSPANGATAEGPIDFTWNPVSGAIRYILFARFGDGTPTPVADTTETQITLTPPGSGRLEWWIVAQFRGCDPTESQHFVVNVTRPQNCTDRKPILLLPRGEREVSPPAHLAWTAVPNATGYRIWASQGDERPSIILTTADTQATVALGAGTYTWFAEAELPAGCPPVFSARGEFTVGEAVPCGTPAQPEIHAVGRALSNTAYVVRWTPLPNVDRYELQEATSADFADAQTFTVAGLRKQFTHEATHTIQHFYRVRGISNCNEERGAYSEPAVVLVVNNASTNVSAELGSAGTITQKIFVPGGSAPQPFTAKTDKPWATVTPASGTIPPEGIELTVTSDESQLGVGTNTFSLNVELLGATSNGVRTHGATLTTPISVSLVTPVTPAGSGTPSPDSLIFSAVGHAVGQNDSLFESDVRVTNLSAQTMKYQVHYTPSGTDGTLTGSSTTIEIAPNQTVALDDVVASVFGSGTTSSSQGMLEVRPLTTSSTSSGFFSTISSTAQQQLTLGSSRTYNFTANGTFGQFIPATPFSKFVGTSKVLSLLQVTQNEAYRANFGFLEASGQPVNLVARAYDARNTLLGTIPVALQAREHKQIGLFLAQNGINDLDDGRVEVEVTSGSGKITAYVSEVDNATNDPLLVSAVEKGVVSANRYVVPGMAHKDLGFAFWVSDLRIFNSGTTTVPATLTFYAETNPASFSTKQVTLDPGEIEVLNDVVHTLFGQPNGAGGSIVITTPQNVPLTVTARTYNQTTAGTYGQYIPGVTVAESVGAGDRALQILQVEHSTRMRTNIGVNETTGNPVRIEVSLIQPDSIATPVITYDLAANEYRQFSVGDFGVGDALYNGRVTVKAISGTGKVTAYGSLIDMQTNDPAYIPSQ